MDILHVPYEIHVTEETYHLSQTNKKKIALSPGDGAATRCSQTGNRSLGQGSALPSAAARPWAPLLRVPESASSSPASLQPRCPGPGSIIFHGHHRTSPFASFLSQAGLVSALRGESFLWKAHLFASPQASPGLASVPSPLPPRSCPLFPVFSAVMSNSPTPRHWILPKCSLTNCQDYSLSFFRILFKCHFFPKNIFLTSLNPHAKLL